MASESNGDQMKTAQEMYAIALPVQKANEIASIAVREERKLMVLAAIMRRIEDAANSGDMSCFLDINNDYPEAGSEYPETGRAIMQDLKNAGYLVEYVFQYDDHSDDVFGWHVSWHPKATGELNQTLWEKIKSWFVGCET